MRLLNLVALTAAAAAATESDDPLITKYPQLVSWFTSNGGVIDPRIKIGYDEKGIRGMIATQPIEKDTVIINCPGSLVVKPDAQESTDQCAPVANIIEHLKAGEKSVWHPYFDFDDSLGSRIPSEWKENSPAIVELQGLPPTGETHRHINWLVISSSLQCMFHDSRTLLNFVTCYFASCRYKNTCKNGQDLSEVEMRAFKIFLTRAADIGLIPMYGKKTLRYTFTNGALLH